MCLLRVHGIRPIDFSRMGNRMLIKFMVPKGRLWDGYWVTKVSAGDFVGLSTMLNNIS